MSLPLSGFGLRLDCPGSLHSMLLANRGPSAGDHVLAITLLGAFNTVIAGILALIKGQGLPDRLYHDRAEFRRLQDWYGRP